MAKTIPPLGGLNFAERRAALATDKRLARLEGREQGNAYSRPENDQDADLSVRAAREALLDHINDVENAHEASAVSFDPSLLSPISQVWFGSGTDELQQAISTIVAEIDGRIEAGDVDAIITAINNWEDGDETLTNPDVFESELIVTRALAARAVIASKIAANAVEASKVQADAIDGRSIRAGTQLTVGEGVNRITITGTDRPESTSIRSGGTDLSLVTNQGESSTFDPTWSGPGDSYQFITYSTGFVLEPGGRPLLLPTS